MDYFPLFFRELKLVLMRSRFGLGVERISPVAAHGVLRGEKQIKDIVCMLIAAGGSSASIDIMPDCV